MNRCVGHKFYRKYMVICIKLKNFLNEYLLNTQHCGTGGKVRKILVGVIIEEKYNKYGREWKRKKEERYVTSWLETVRGHTNNCRKNK